MIPSANPQPFSTPNAGRRFRILYAEDVRELREVARLTLTLDGHSIECVQDGKLALERVTADPAAFDLIITDHYMPNMTGLEFVENLRAMKFSGKIVIFSSDIKPATREAYVALNVDRILPKPIFPSELRRVLTEL
jgi:two-component system chemotaxis response regulator CheY